MGYFSFRLDGLTQFLYAVYIVLGDETSWADFQWVVLYTGATGFNAGDETCISAHLAVMCCIGVELEAHGEFHYDQQPAWVVHKRKIRSLGSGDDVRRDCGQWGWCQGGLRTVGMMSGGGCRQWGRCQEGLWTRPGGDAVSPHSVDFTWFH